MSMKIFRVAIVVGCLWVAQANALECASGQTPSQMAQSITERVRPAFANEQLDIQLTPIGDLPVMASPRVRLLSTHLRSRVAVELKGTVCGQTHASQVTVWFKVQAWGQAWVYGRNGRTDQALSDTQPRRERLDVVAAKVSPDDLASNLEGAWLGQMVNAGMPILNRHLKAEPLVLRDATVTVVVYGPGLMLRTEGKAMRPGVLGEPIPVLVNGAQASLLAVVAGKGEVHVQR
jgi:flagella basal body P-ring formation protein FlgA